MATLRGCSEMELPLRRTTHSAEETEKLGYAFSELLKADDFVALYGDLGVGKTAFVRGMAARLAPEAAVQSPTYSIVNDYGGRLLHCDMYRIGGEDDLYSIGFYDYGGCVIAAEWCENIPFALPETFYRVTLYRTPEDENSRRITIEKVEHETAGN